MSGTERYNAVLRAVREGRLHAVLLLMPDGCGRSGRARELAAEYLGSHRELIAADAHPDCLVVRGEGKAGQIKTGALGDALFEINRGSALGDRRAVIIEDAGALNAFSSAKLLKTLEEPPPGVMFILTAAGIDSVEPTVASRCAAVLLPAPKERDAKTENERLCAEVFGIRQESADAALGDPKRLVQARAARDFVDDCEQGNALMIMKALSAERQTVLTLISDALCCAERRLVDTGGGARTIDGLITLRDDLLRFVNPAAAAANFCINLTTER